MRPRCGCSNAGFDIATPVGLLLAAVLAAVSSIEFSTAATRRLRRLRPTLWIAVAGVLVGWAVLSLLEAPILARPFEADSGQRLLVAAAFLGAVLYGVSALRYSRLTKLYGSGRDQQDGITIPLTQEEIAGLAGTSRATVNRVLRELAATATVSLNRGRVTVTDPQGLLARNTRRQDR